MAVGSKIDHAKFKVHTARHKQSICPCKRLATWMESVPHQWQVSFLQPILKSQKWLLTTKTSSQRGSQSQVKAKNSFQFKSVKIKRWEHPDAFYNPKKRELKNSASINKVLKKVIEVVP